MKQHFDEDRAEIDAHFAERVQAYVELGETQAQAEASAREKFGEVEPIVRQLGWQRVRQHPMTIGALAGCLWLAGYLPLALPTRAAFTSLFEASRQLGEPTPPMFAWYSIEATLLFLPTAMGAAILGRRFPKRHRAILWGTVAFSVFGVPNRDPITFAIFATLAWLGALYGVGRYAGTAALRSAAPTTFELAGIRL